MLKRQTKPCKLDCGKRTTSGDVCKPCLQIIAQGDTPAARAKRIAKFAQRASLKLPLFAKESPTCPASYLP